jgi:hypothetical protein
VVITRLHGLEARATGHDHLGREDGLGGFD